MIMNLKQIRILVVAAVIFIVLDVVFMRVNYGMLSRQLIDVQGSSIRPKQVGFIMSYVFLLGGLDHKGTGRRPVPLRGESCLRYYEVRIRIGLCSGKNGLSVAPCCSVWSSTASMKAPTTACLLNGVRRRPS